MLNNVGKMLLREVRCQPQDQQSHCSYKSESHTVLDRVESLLFFCSWQASKLRHTGQQSFDYKSGASRARCPYVFWGPEARMTRNKRTKFIKVIVDDTLFTILRKNMLDERVTEFLW